MKKIVKRIVLIILIFLLLRLVFFIFKTNHKIEYKIKSNNTNISVEGKYQNKMYYFKLSVGDNMVTYYLKDTFYKNKKVIKDIYYYSNNNIMCFFPIFKNNITSSIKCIRDKKIYSYENIKDLDTIKPFIDILKNKGYTFKASDNATKKIGYINVYYNNLVEDSYIYIWKYNGIYAVNKKKIEAINIFENDIYDNNLGVLADKYYVIPNYNEKYKFNEMYIYNITNNKRRVLKLPKNVEISYDSYINGIHNKLVYLLDTDNIKQYTINPTKKTIKEIANKEIDATLYVNNSLEKVNIYDLVKQEKYFTINENIPEKLKKYDRIYQAKNGYVYIDNNYVYLYDDIFDVSTLLFKNDNIKNIKVVENDIYFISDNILYCYHDSLLYKILSYDEFRYNNKNIYSVYKK